MSSLKLVYQHFYIPVVKTLSAHIMRLKLIDVWSKCTLVGTFRGTLTNGEEHRAGALTASWARPTVAEDSPLLRHQVILESLDQQVLALRVVTHQQLCVHIAHQKVSPQQRQPHTLHQLRKCDEGVLQIIVKLKQIKCDGNSPGYGETSLTHGTCCLRPSISCFTQLSTARYTSSSDGTLRLSLEIKSRTWMRKQTRWGKTVYIIIHNPSQSL